MALAAALLGGVIAGVLLTYAAAWAAARARILALEEEQEAELLRRAALQEMREEAIARSRDVEHADLNAWQKLRAAHEESVQQEKAGAGVLELRRRDKGV